jgi:hypothetical protein
VPSARRWARSCSMRLFTSMSSVAISPAPHHQLLWHNRPLALAYSLRAFACVSGVARFFAGPGHV